MPLTPKSQLPYPTPDDPVAAGAADIQALATALDGKVRSEIMGRVSAAGAILAGTGFTVVHDGTGLYTVTYAPAFAAEPLLVVQLDFNGAGAFFTCTLRVSDNTHFQTDIRSSAVTLIDSGFMFRATPVV